MPVYKCLKKLILIQIVFIVLPGANPQLLRIFETDSYKSVPQIIQERGYPFEMHNLTVGNGYIVSLFRIPHGRTLTQTQAKATTERKVVYLQHGNFADGGSWILNSVDKALAYRLSDLEGVDVWIGNNRGTKYSLDHESLDFREFEYWNFGFHEIGMDLHFIYDYILKTTGQPDLYVIAHSMGSAEFLVSMITNPEYIPKIRTFIGLGPAVFQGNTSNPIFTAIAPFVRMQQRIHDALLIGPMVPPQILPVMGVVGDACSPNIASRWICMMLLYAMFGFDPEGYNYDMTSEIMSHILSSTSSKKAFHALQLMRSPNFEQYNYFERNQEVYGSEFVNPPIYDLSGVTVPVVIFHATEDDVVTPPDVRKTAAHLPNVKEVTEVQGKFNHIDFLLHKDINKLMNDRIVEIIKNDLYYVPQSN